MRQLALTIQNGGTGYTVTGPKNFVFENAPVSEVITKVLGLFIMIVAFIMFFWMIWGIFQYIAAGGNKEQLARARSRITWAIVGFLIVVMAFTIARYFTGLIQPAVNPIAP